MPALHTCTAQRLEHPAGHGADVGAPVAPDLGLVADAPQGDALERAAQHLRYRPRERGLALRQGGAGGGGAAAFSEGCNGGLVAVWTARASTDRWAQETKGRQAPEQAVPASPRARDQPTE